MYDSGSGSKEKMDVLDLIIETLREHEKSLDALTERLQSLVETFSSQLTKGTAEPSAPTESVESEPSPPKASYPMVECRRWDDFKKKSTQAEVVTFEIDERELRICCALSGVVYRHILVFSPSSSLRNWLSENLGISEEKIVEGRITR